MREDVALVNDTMNQLNGHDHSARLTAGFRTLENPLKCQLVVGKGSPKETASCICGVDPIPWPLHGVFDVLSIAQSAPRRDIMNSKGIDHCFSGIWEIGGFSRCFSLCNDLACLD